MCGIAGVVAHGEERGRASTELMLAAQRHRGPDDADVRVVRPAHGDAMSVSLGACRLAILDLSVAGRQPMHDPSNGNWIVHNGEVYNFLELRRELEGKGETFVSDADTEVLLASYRVWGGPAIRRWRGMFACAIWDASREEIVLVRDPLGIKPLYWATGREGAVVFASEVRALLASTLIEGGLDAAAVWSFLSQGAVRAPATMLREARSVPPASCVTISARGRVMVGERYWDLARCEVQTQRDPNDAIKVRDAIEDAVETHLVSDVPLGVFLSGGIDSSAIVALMSRVAAAPVRTFSVVFEDPACSEAAFSRQIASAWTTEHTELAVSETEARALVLDAVEHMDQPSVDGVNSFIVSRAARRAGVKAALSGLGGDEVFGGYSTFRRVPLLAGLGALAGHLPAPVASALPALLGRARRPRGIAGRLAELVQGAGDMLSAYLSARTVFAPDAIAALTGGALARAGERFAGDDDRLRARMRDLDAFRQISLLEIELYMGSTLLRDTDVMSMANSVEVRVPLLDQRLVEYVWSLPAASKRRGGRPKGLLVEALGRDLPARVAARPKKGFMLPWARWMRGALRPALDDALARVSGPAAAVLDGRACARLWSAFARGTEDRGWSRVWALYVLCRWLERAGRTPGRGA